MMNNKVENIGYTANRLSENVMSIPNLTPSDRFFLNFELARISELMADYSYDYFSTLPPFKRPGEEGFLMAYDPTKYGLTRASVVYTADNVVFTRGDDGRLKVLLIQRKGHPYKDFWCTPGGFIDRGESALGAAIRELQEETGMVLPDGSLRYVKTYDFPWRDTRMQNVHAHAHVAFIPHIPKFEAADDAVDAKLVDVAEIFSENSHIAIGFDHKQLVADSVHYLMR